MKVITPPAGWDAMKFATRYSLDYKTDFYLDGNRQLHYPDALPDAPIFDFPDPFVPMPISVHAHHWPSMAGWLDGKKVDMTETSTGHHECYYIVADNQAALDAFTAIPAAEVKAGQLAFLTDHNHLMYWNGTMWKQGW